MAGALRIFVGTDAEVEANCDHVSDVLGSRVRGAGCHDKDGVNDS